MASGSIRIKDLPAGTVASSNYVAIDSTANGTQSTTVQALWNIVGVSYVSGAITGSLDAAFNNLSSSTYMSSGLYIPNMTGTGPFTTTTTLTDFKLLRIGKIVQGSGRGSLDTNAQFSGGAKLYINYPNEPFKPASSADVQGFFSPDLLGSVSARNVKFSMNLTASTLSHLPSSSSFYVDLHSDFSGGCNFTVDFMYNTN